MNLDQDHTTEFTKRNKERIHHPAFAGVSRMRLHGWWGLGLICFFLLIWSGKYGLLTSSNDYERLRSGALLLAIIYCGAGLALVAAARERLLGLWIVAQWPAYGAHFYLVDLGFALPSMPSGYFLIIGPVLVSMHLMVFELGAELCSRFPDSRAAAAVYRLSGVPLVIQFAVFGLIAAAGRPPGWSVVTSVYALAGAVALVSGLTKKV